MNGEKNLQYWHQQESSHEVGQYEKAAIENSGFISFLLNSNLIVTIPVCKVYFNMNSNNICNKYDNKLSWVLWLQG